MIIHNNADKVYRGELTRVADEKLMINESGSKVCTTKCVLPRAERVRSTSLECILYF